MSVDVSDHPPRSDISPSAVTGSPPAVRVVLWGSLKPLVGGQDVLHVHATTTGQMLDALQATYPALQPHIARGVSVSVDGRLYRDSRIIAIGPESEIFLLPRLAGG